MSDFFDNEDSGFISISSISFGDNKCTTVRYSATFMPELQMPNEDLTCPRCGTTIHSVQKNRRLGCINCYTVFEGQIGKMIKRIQPDIAYMGRAKGDEGVDIVDVQPDVAPKTEESILFDKNSTVDVKKELSDEDKLDKLRKADLGMMSDDDIEKNMRFAAGQRDYILAGRLKEELNSRKGK